MVEYERCKKNLKKDFASYLLPRMAEDITKTTINIRTAVYIPSKERAKKLGINFGELVERALERDLAERMAILRTSEGRLIYAPMSESPAPLSSKQAAKLLADSANAGSATKEEKAR
jgi:hypothetical protein